MLSQVIAENQAFSVGEGFQRGHKEPALNKLLSKKNKINMAIMKEKLKGNQNVKHYG